MTEQRNEGRVVLVHSALSIAISMKHQYDDFRASHFKAIRTRLGAALREQYDLTEPPAQSLIDLLRKLEISKCARETTEARLYAEVDECVAAMVQTANRKPRKPGA
jgi:hypothetical protein